MGWFRRSSTDSFFRAFEGSVVTSGSVIAIDGGAVEGADEGVAVAGSLEVAGNESES